ncbi:ribosomal protein S5 domain 2-type protein [Echria macrotheca]|uniref:Ribosomal protein S5 domain 2-type protein n=1 Tax=Echria macrotheca TaxID=438768 RepID=A0AAJ0BM27_9PEZI|nr:ribosomal protein S5 domain 2-type protein [Echria macrotheca]
MSEALSDEVEAINSIYGDGTLTQSDTPQEYILTLPASQNDQNKKKRSSLRLRFPEGYPDVPPVVVGTLGYLSLSSGTVGGGGGGGGGSGSGSVRKGDAAREMDLFVAALGDVFVPGEVCLFDALERVGELFGSGTGGGGGGSGEEEDGDGLVGAGAGADVGGGGGGGTDPGEMGQQQQHTTRRQEPEPKPEQELGGLEPPWILSPPITEQKSTFLARCAPVTSPAQAQFYLSHLLSTDKRARQATHNISAWRIRGPGGQNGVVYQDCDDDGETAAGSRLLHLMQVMEIWDVMVVVSRWYGGLKLGPRRFALINLAARGAFVEAGLVPGTGTGAEEGRGTGSGAGAGGKGKKKGR